MITFIPTPKDEGKNKMLKILRSNPSRAKFFSRSEPHKELIAIVLSDDFAATDMFYWIWLSGSAAGAFADGKKRHIEEVAQSLERGEWNYQPNIQISLEHLKGA